MPVPLRDGPKARGSATAREPGIDPRDVLAALREVADPEIPTVSIVDLGMIEGIEVRPDEIEVELLPTFVGCPALEMIQASVEERLAAFGRPVRVRVSFSTPWTSERISPEGRERLRRSGFAPPPPAREGRSLPMLDAGPAAPGLPSSAPPESVACPYCGSTATTLENAFGPTQCRTIRHCAACRQPFEAFKEI